jgi:hypothetical protein
MGGPHSQSTHAEEKTFLPLLGIKPQFLSQPESLHQVCYHTSISIKLKTCTHKRKTYPAMTMKLTNHILLPNSKLN